MAAGVDVMLDMVAGAMSARKSQCLAEDGRLVIIAVQGGVQELSSTPGWYCAGA